VVLAYGDLAPVFDVIFHLGAGAAAERVPRPWFLSTAGATERVMSQ
jgi:hypothetical protein